VRTEPGARYRWLAVGDRVRYVGRQGREGLRGRIGTVTAVPEYRGGPKNVAVLLDGGDPLLAPAGTWRKAPPEFPGAIDGRLRHAHHLDPEVGHGCDGLHFRGTPHQAACYHTHPGVGHLISLDAECGFVRDEGGRIRAISFGHVTVGIGP
jgi:hypothetical protein